MVDVQILKSRANRQKRHKNSNRAVAVAVRLYSGCVSHVAGGPCCLCLPPPHYLLKLSKHTHTHQSSRAAHCDVHSPFEPHSRTSFFVFVFSPYCGFVPSVFRLITVLLYLSSPLCVSYYICLLPKSPHSPVHLQSLFILGNHIFIHFLLFF